MQVSLWSLCLLKHWAVFVTEAPAIRAPAISLCHSRFYLKTFNQLGPLSIFIHSTDYDWMLNAQLCHAQHLQPLCLSTQLLPRFSLWFVTHLYVSILALSTFLPSFLSFLCLSLLSVSVSFSLSCSILLLPVIRALWSGPARRIRVGPAGSLTWGERGTSN